MGIREKEGYKSKFSQNLVLLTEMKEVLDQGKYQDFYCGPIVFGLIDILGDKNLPIIFRKDPNYHKITGLKRNPNI